MLTHLPQFELLQGPSDAGTKGEVIADLCAVLIDLYQGEDVSLPATKEDACIFRTEVETRLRQWMKALPNACETCHEVRHIGPCVRPQAN